MIKIFQMVEWRYEKDQMEDDERMVENWEIRRKLCVHQYKYLMNSISGIFYQFMQINLELYFESYEFSKF